jgi:histidinol-phosphate aminotransferase
VTDWSSLVVPSVQELAPLDVDGTVSQLRALGSLDARVKLDWNENLFGPLPGVREAVVDELAMAPLYPIEAYDDFRTDVAAHAGVDRGWVVPGHGIQSLICTIATAFLQPGDRVVAPAITYYLYAVASAARGAVVERVPLRDQALDPDALAAAARERRAKIVWICDPNNPTGSALGRAEWEAFLDALPEGCIAVADEAYADFLPHERRVRREDDVGAGRSVIVLRTFSKLYGLAGLRIGYAIVAPEVAGALAVVDEPFNVNCAGLAAARASLSSPEAAESRRLEVAAARDRLVRGLREAGTEPYPSDASFVLAQVGRDDVELTRELAAHGVLVRPGSELGLAEHIRVTVGPPPLMDRVTRELARSLVG